ncbi:MAG TPA: M28 family peptidase [Candidatus Angelobacter sp.]|nr:M28 family peptidase [Candidatus Angelobacter sp.]
MKTPFAFASSLLVALFAAPLSLFAQKPPLLPEKDVAALAQELSGETAKRNLEGITRNHRQRGSGGFHAAAELIAERARAYGLSDVTILQFPADGKIFYGPQRSRMPWEANSAELWELKKENTENNVWRPAVLLANYESVPVSLAEDSESADVTADLIDVGNGTAESDYAGKDVRGKIVLAASQPGAVQNLAVEKFGAAGMISYALNQRTAWWGEDENLIRWGHLSSFPKTKTFAFMVSLKTARTLRERLAHGEQIHLHATVQAGQHPGNYEVVTATIPGTAPELKDEEIAFSCHLDHQRPGANDNASGCATILEVARTLHKLIAEGKLAPPARTIRFIWPPEIEGTVTLLNARPDFAKRIKAAIHMDMVGGGPETKAIFHVTRGPLSLPSFVHDVAEAFADFANEQTEKYAKTGVAEYPLIAPEGGKEPLRAEFAAFSMGSDHDAYQEGSFRIPAIYMNDWPDRYIHTNFDSAANIDPTKLKRAGFIGAASGYFLAQATTKDIQPVSEQIAIEALRRKADGLQRARNLSEAEAANLDRAWASYTAQLNESFRRFTGAPAAEQRQMPASAGLSSDQASLARVSARVGPESPATGDGLLVFKRKDSPKGPLAVFGYDYLEDHVQATGLSSPLLTGYQGLWGAGEEYAYEALNFVDGKRNAQQIRDAVSAEYGPAPLDLVVEYLKALEKIGVLTR